MDDKCFHRLPTGNEKVAMGKAKVFPNPFYYEPSPLARCAVTLLQQSLPMLKEGKMVAGNRIQVAQNPRC